MAQLNELGFSVLELDVVDAQPLHFLIQSGAVDAELIGSLIAAETVETKYVQDNLTFWALEGIAKCLAAREQGCGSPANLMP